MLTVDLLKLLARITQGVTLMYTPQGLVIIYPNHIHKHTYPHLHGGNEYGFNYTKWNLSTGRKKKVMHVEVDPDNETVLSFEY